MGNSYKIKRNKYLSLMYLLKSYRKTRKVAIKSSKVDFKRLAKYNKKESEPYVILSTYGSVIDPLIMKRNFSPILGIFYTV